MFARRSRLSIACLLCLSSLLCSDALAHDHSGPPAPIATEEPLGSWIVSVWIQPHMGTASIFVHLHSTEKKQSPSSVKVEIGVLAMLPASKEVFYPVDCEQPDAGQCKADLPFDESESHRLKIRLLSSQQAYDFVCNVEASPSGPAAWQIALYLFPFLAVGGLWFRVNYLRRATRHKLIQSAGSYAPPRS